jgi:hypothetical protein
MSERLSFEVGVRFDLRASRVGVRPDVGVHGRVGVARVGVALPEVGVGQRSQTAPTVGVPAHPVA